MDDPTRSTCKYGAPPEELLEHIRQGRCLLFVGAGLSTEAGYPDSDKLADDLRKKIPEPNRPVQGTPLPDVAQKYLDLHLGSRGNLEAVLWDAFKLPAGRSPDMTTLRCMAHIPYLTKDVITTNWDNLLETAVRDQTDADPACVTDDQSLPSGRGENDRAVYHMHGAFSKPGTIKVTRDDENEVIGKLKKPESLFMDTIRVRLREHIVIFVGYRLRDRDFEELCSQIVESLTDQETMQYRGWQNYAIIPGPKLSDADYASRRKDYETQRGDLAAKHVHLIDSDARTFFRDVYMQTVDFKNRGEELKQLRNAKEPYVEVTGNVGSGKTTLLRRIQWDYKLEKQWDTVKLVDLSPSPAAGSADPIGKIANKLELSGRLDAIQAMNKRRGFLLLLDGIDDMAPADLDAFCRDSLGKMINPDSPLERIIWSGRHSVRERLPDDLKSRMEQVALSMFKDDDVAEMVRDYAGAMHGVQIDQTKSHELGRAILKVTGDGHPGLIKATLEYLGVEKERGADAFHPLYVEKQARKILNDVCMPIIDKNLPTEPLLRKALTSTLCALRGCDAGLLEKLGVDAKLDLGGMGEDEFKRALYNTHLFDLESHYPLMWLDSVVRHVLQQRLRSSQVVAVSEVCASYYFKAVRDGPKDYQQPYIVECLWHWATLQLFQVKSPADKVCEKRYEAILSHVRDIVVWTSDETTKRFAGRIMDDTELWQLLGTCLGSKRDELLEELQHLRTESP